MTLTGYADTPEAMEAYRFYQDLYIADRLAPNAEVPDAFATGQSITMISFLATANLLNSQFPELEWGLMPLPYFVTPLTHTSGFAYSVSAKTKCPDLAKDFVRFACSDEGIMIFFDASGTDLLSKAGFADEHPEYYTEDYQKFFQKNLEMYGEARPKTQAYTIYNQVLGFDMFIDLALGGSNAKLANILEYGKHGQPAKPFLKPAKSASRAECIRVMKQKLEEEVVKL